MNTAYTLAWLKKFTTWLIVVIIALLLTSCGTAADKKADTTALHIGTLAIADALPLLVAEQEGYFWQNGLTVKIQTFKSSSDEAQAFQAGQLDIVMNDMVVQSLLKKDGFDNRIIATALGATPQEGRFVILGAPNHNLTSPAQLAGKKVAISTNTMMEYLTDSYLQEATGSTKGQVQYLNMPNLLLRLETLLDGKELDAAILPDPLAAIALARGATPIIDDSLLDHSYSQSVILASMNWLQNSPDQRSAFLKAYNQAITAINKNPEKYRELLIKTARVPKELAPTYPMPTFTPQAVPTAAEAAHLQQWLVQKGLLSKAFTYEELLAPAAK